MRPSIYRELPADKQGCFGRGFPEHNPACGTCAGVCPELARLCVEIRAGTTADGYIKIAGHDPIRVTREPATGVAVYQVEPERGARPPAVLEVRRALIFAERSDYEPPALQIGLVTSKLFPDTAGWMRYPELFANERPTQTETPRSKKRPAVGLTPASDTLF